ncbi:ABC transporter ATP-binding protein [Aquabacterium sp.]|uniref:ABC transporter ATP-binding protein n=1 Tax=Aquabacterium sp. TaxID=1872578 RepID=UPI0035AE123B
MTVQHTHTPLLAARHVGAEHDGKQVLHGVDLWLEPGCWLALVGPNGAGKSTLLRCLAGLQALTEGHIKFMGRNLDEWSPRERALQLSWMGQQDGLGEGLTVRDTVALGRLPYLGWMGLGWLRAADEHAIAQALLDTGLETMAHRRLETLSGGEQQRVRLARSLCVKAQLVLLDEPTSYLDVPHQRLLTRVLQREAREGRTIISSVHDLSLALLADQVAVIDQGRIVAAGRSDDTLVHRAIEQVFRQAVSIMPVQERWVAVPQL